MDTVQINISKSVDFSDVDIPYTQTEFETYKKDGWEFFLSNKLMFSSKEQEKIFKIMGIKKLPDMLYGYNKFIIINKNLDFLLEFNALDMLNYASYEKREATLDTSAVNFASKDLNPDKIDFRSAEPSTSLMKIYYLPNELKVQFAEQWKLVKVERDDIEKREPVFDWTFSTSYMGTICNLSDSKICQVSQNGGTKPVFKIVATKDTIPLNRLGQDNPIQHYSEVKFFDDELCDNGQCSGNIR